MTLFGLGCIALLPTLLTSKEDKAPEKKKEEQVPIELKTK